MARIITITTYGEEVARTIYNSATKEIKKILFPAIAGYNTGMSYMAYLIHTLEQFQAHFKDEDQEELTVNCINAAWPLIADIRRYISGGVLFGHTNEEIQSVFLKDKELGEEEGELWARFIELFQYFKHLNFKSLPNKSEVEALKASGNIHRQNEGKAVQISWEMTPARKEKIVEDEAV